MSLIRACRRLFSIGKAVPLPQTPGIVSAAIPARGTLVTEHASNLDPLSLEKLYGKITDPTTSAPELVDLSNQLVSVLEPTGKRSPLSPSQKLHILKMLSARTVRHEAILARCIWDLLKMDPSEMIEVSSSALFARYTAATFQSMMELRFTRDPQMVSLAFGRSVEVAPVLTIGGVADVFNGLRAFGRSYYSLTELGLSLEATNINPNGSIMDQHEAYPVPTDADLINQPNLVAVLCDELEARLQCLADEGGPSLLVARNASPTSPDACNRSEAHVAHQTEALLSIVSSLEVVGVGSPYTLDALKRMFCRAPQLTVAQLVWALMSVCAVRSRVVDVLDHQEAPEMAEQRRAMMNTLAQRLFSCSTNLSTELRKAPQTLLQLRQLYEKSTEMMECTASSQLWDVVRQIRVAHRHTLQEKAATGRLPGKLFEKQYDVKVKRVSVDDSDAERYIPPVFKTWRTPQHHSKGHRHSGPRRTVAFGTRRISKDYLKNKRKRYCPSR